MMKPPARPYSVGDLVYFGRTHGEKTLGRVRKINAASVSVEQVESRGTMKDHKIGTLWRVHPNLVTAAPLGTQAPAPAAPAPKRPEAEILRDVAFTYGALSPENLTCDGELPMSAVRAKSARLHRRLEGLFAELGRRVSESAAYAALPSRAA